MSPTLRSDSLKNWRGPSPSWRAIATIFAPSDSNTARTGTRERSPFTKKGDSASEGYRILTSLWHTTNIWS